MAAAGPRGGDPPVLSVASLVLLGAVILAAWLPARRAARVDAAESLRAE